VSSSPTDAAPESPAAASVEPAALAPEVPRDIRVALFRLVLLQRLIEERVVALYRQGRIPGSVYTGRGQEGVAAGTGLALGPGDVMAPINRELAAHLARGTEVAHVFRNFLGRATGPTRGRDGNMHFGSVEHNVFPLVSMLGSLVPLTVGAALAFKRRGEPRVALTFFGDGAMSTGDVHEGLNLAAVLQVPAVFVLQNNGYAYSTPIARQMANTNMSERIQGGWGIPAERVDGTDALAVYVSVVGAIERARAGEGPQAVEALSLRMDGHAAHDDGRYMDQDRRRLFAERFDPVERLAARLRLDGMQIAEIDALRSAALAEVADGLAEAEAAPAPDASTLADGIYAMPPEGFTS
jgi:TPP-dependent pyruvate/acetoin dehydrogenase alpha subunit